MNRPFDRRTALRGMMGGAAVSVALPFLDCFLDTNGTALAVTGAPLPVRFGTWFWGCGMTPERWIPKATGKNFSLSDVPELSCVEPIRGKINILSGFDVRLDGATNRPHVTGNMGLITGTTPLDPDKHDVHSLDVVIADTIGTGTRFRSLEVTATGNPKDSYSRRGANNVNPAEGSPVAFYTRLFGPEFQDPNAADFKPDPLVMSRLSVLSAVKDGRDRLMNRVGSHDRARLDEYFSSIRQLEQQLQLQLEKPAHADACAVPAKPADRDTGYEVFQVIENHKIMAQLVASALACNQTRVFNMVFSDALSNLHHGGKEYQQAETHHNMTHLEIVDPKLGYQIRAAWYFERSMEAWVTFVQTLDSIKEGNGTLLDNSLVFAHSDSSLARTHSMVGVPMMTAGTAGGRVRGGLHISGGGDPVTRVGLTMQQVMGVPVDRWGTKSMEATKPVSEILV
jgi:hypothetical protein